MVAFYICAHFVMEFLSKDIFLPRRDGATIIRAMLIRGRGQLLILRWVHEHRWLYILLYILFAESLKLFCFLSKHSLYVICRFEYPVLAPTGGWVLIEFTMSEKHVLVHLVKAIYALNIDFLFFIVNHGKFCRFFLILDTLIYYDWQCIFLLCKADLIIRFSFFLL